MTKPGAAQANTGKKGKTGKAPEPPEGGKESSRHPDAARADTGKSDKFRQTPEPPKPGEPTNGLLAAAAGLLEGYARIMSQLAGGGADPAQDGAASQFARGKGATPALVESWTIASASSMRYAQGLTEVFSRHQGALLKAGALRISGDGPTTAQQRAEAEEFRQFLREVGETAMLEARRLEQALDRLGEAVAPKSASDTPKRSSAVKP